MKKISFIIPVYNEEENVLAAYDRVTSTMEPLTGKYDYEIVFTDNHSTDTTFDILRDLARKDKHLRVIRFSRNFGYQRSILTGYGMSSGDAVIQMDCDLQDPPEMVPEFLEKWEQGFAVVYGVRTSRREGFGISLARRIFYRVLDALSPDPLPHDAGDFRLVDRRVVNELSRYYDYTPYIRGAIAVMGFDQIGVPYARHERRAGRTKFSLLSYVALAGDGLINHSVIPLRLASVVGLIAFLGSIILGFIYFIGRVFLVGTWPSGFATLALLLLISISLNSLFLGVLGEYIARMYQQVKRRPITIIEKTVNLEDLAGADSRRQDLG